MIARTKEKVDFLIVSFHWGVEKTLVPTERQVQLAHMAADAGADVVFGHHPHYPQTFEKYKNTPVFYGLGEFIFYRSSRNQEIVSLKFSKNGTTKTIDYSIIPIVITNGKPYYLKMASGSNPAAENSTMGEPQQ
jgi:poly-gamma-glutamate synthesis protein (capsule biosynthesis protein)